MGNRKYDPEIRLYDQTWLLAHIQFLLHSAKEEKNSTYIIYGCFECRNLIESIEYEIITLSMTEDELVENRPLLKKKDGLKNVFRRINGEATIYKYLEFVQALIVVYDLPEKTISFNFKKSNDLKNKLNAYCHLYGLNNNDFTFNSDFINQGIKLIDETIDELVQQGILDNKGMVFNGISIKDMPPYAIPIYKSFQKNEINSQVELIEILKNMKGHYNSPI